MNITLQAFLLADHIYREEASGKYVIAGTFHELSAASFPSTFGRSIGIFVSLSGLEGKAALNLTFADASNGEVLMQMNGLEIVCDDPDLPIEFAVEVPPLSLPHAGYYIFRLGMDDAVLGTASVFVTGGEGTG